MYKRGFSRIADRGPAGFGVKEDTCGHVDIGKFIHIDMAVALAGLDHRYPGILYYAADEPRAAPGDEHVEIADQAHHFLGGFPGGVLDKLDAVCGHSCLFGSFPHGEGNGAVGMEGFLPAAQDHGVAGFETQGRGVGGDVGTGFIDDSHHAQRYADLLHLQAVGQYASLDQGSHGILHSGNFLNPFGNVLNAFMIQGQAVEHRRAHAVGSRGLAVERVGGQQIGFAAAQGGGNFQQGLGFLFGSPLGQIDGGCFGFFSHGLKFCHQCNTSLLGFWTG